MFGGGTTNTVQPDGQQDNAMADAPSNGLTPGDAPAAGYEATTYSPTAPADPAAPAADPAAVAAPAEPVADPTVAAPAAPVAQPEPAVAGVPDVTVASDDLLNIKQQALQQLSPLVGHLDQTPEEKFRTTMMMIQASDNADLIKDAYAAAQQIPDEKARAQAYLDVVNEINYFTQHHEQQ